MKVLLDELDSLIADFEMIDSTISFKIYITQKDSIKTTYWNGGFTDIKIVNHFNRNTFAITNCETYPSFFAKCLENVVLKHYDRFYDIQFEFYHSFQDFWRGFIWNETSGYQSCGLLSRPFPLFSESP